MPCTAHILARVAVNYTQRNTESIDQLFLFSPLKKGKKIEIWILKWISIVCVIITAYTFVVVVDTLWSKTCFQAILMDGWYIVGVSVCTIGINIWPYPSRRHQQRFLAASAFSSIRRRIYDDVFKMVRVVNAGLARIMQATSIPDRISAKWRWERSFVPGMVVSFWPGRIIDATRPVSYQAGW